MTALQEEHKTERFEEDFVVSTFASKKDPVELNPGTLSSQELSTLKTRDAFMYYSIPEVRRAHMEGREVDVDQLRTTQVRRSSAISFESADLGLDLFCQGDSRELMYDDDDMEDDEDDLFGSYLESIH